MKRIAIVILTAGAIIIPDRAEAQSYTGVDFNVLLDTGGNLLGSAPSGQRFDIGGGVIMRVDWSGTFAPNQPSPAGFQGINNSVINAGSGEDNIMTFTLENHTADFFIRNQLAHYVDEIDEVTTNGTGWVFEDVGNRAPTSVIGEGTSVMAVNGGLLDGADWNAGGRTAYNYFTDGASSVSVHYTNGSIHATGNPFRLHTRNITLVPEPSSTALLGAGGLLMILRRRR